MSISANLAGSFLAFDDNRATVAELIEDVNAAIALNNSTAPDYILAIDGALKSVAVAVNPTFALINTVESRNDRGLINFVPLFGNEAVEGAAFLFDSVYYIAFSYIDIRGESAVKYFAEK